MRSAIFNAPPFAAAHAGETHPDKYSDHADTTVKQKIAISLVKRDTTTSSNFSDTCSQSEREKAMREKASLSMGQLK